MLRKAIGALLSTGFAGLILFAAWGAPRAADALVPRVRRVLLVSIDGLRPDLALRADAPALRGLMARGSFTLWAWTTAVAVTLPSHVSMLTGVIPSRHGIEWNSSLPLAHPIYPARPTLFELAKRAGYTTALVAGKSKFSALLKPGTVDRAFVPADTTIEDAAVADTAVRWIERFAPQVLFVHFPQVDITGHDLGWGSDAQLAAIAGADRCLGRLLEALKGRGILDSTFVLVTSDHGGAGRSHGPDDPRSRHIPWIAAGPGIRRNYDLTRQADLTIRTEDTFATACFLLGIVPPDSIDGRAVTQILERR